jgi:VWFA-related protein
MRSFVKTLAAAAVILAAVFGAFAQDDDVIRVDSSLVVLNASITDKNGRSVSGIAEKEFTVFEDGVEQTLELFETSEAPFTAIILFDTSGSMMSRMHVARMAAINFMQGLRPTDTAAIYRFDGEVKVIQDFSQSQFINDRVFELSARGMTYMNDAIVRAANDLSTRTEKRKAIIVLSDGEDTGSKASSKKALNAAIAANATIYTVDLTTFEGNVRGQNTAVLKDLAEKSGGFFIQVKNGQILRDSLERVVQELGTQYTLGYSPKESKSKKKWREIEVVVSRPNLNIRTRKGYSTEGK